MYRDLTNEKVEENASNNQFYSKNAKRALAGVAQLVVGLSSHSWKVVGSIPSQRTCPGCMFAPWLGDI